MWFFIFTIDKANLIQLRQWADLPKQQQQPSSLFDTSNGDDDDDFNPRAGGGAAASGMTWARLTFPLES